MRAVAEGTEWHEEGKDCIRTESSGVDRYQTEELNFRDGSWADIDIYVVRKGGEAITMNHYRRQSTTQTTRR